jgi:putative tricarboxylic transport membrane protein
MNRGNRIWGIVICALGAFYLFEGFNLPPAAIGDPLGPLVFPTILGFSFIACGVYLAVKPGPRLAQPPLVARYFLRVLILFALLLLYSGSISWLGYLPATFLFVLAGAFLMGERSWAKGILLSAAFSTGVFLLFVRVLTIPLPLGIMKMMGFK